MMKLIKVRSVPGSLVGMLLLAILPFFCPEAQARGGGGFVGGGFQGGGGFSGGSFRAGGGWAEGPRGGGFVAGHQEGVFPRPGRGGEFFRTPFVEGGMGKEKFGGEAVRGLHGGEAFTGIRGRTVYPELGRYGGAHMVTAPGNWGPYYGPGWGAAVPGAARALSTGMIVVGLPPAAVAQTVGGRKYFFDGNAYYLPCYQGSELAYCVVPDPNQ